MPSSLSYDDAVRIAGELYGNLLGRNSDKGGFTYTLERLLSGEKSPRDLVKEFSCSEEFRELHLMNQTPNEFARRASLRFLGLKRPEPDKIKEIATRLLLDNWRRVVSDLVDSDEYASIHGNLGVPLWT